MRPEFSTLVIYGSDCTIDLSRYIRTENNMTVEYRPNPFILNLGLGISMACALIANICLIVRFLEKRIKTTTIICVVLLTIHGTSHGCVYILNAQLNPPNYY